MANNLTSPITPVKPTLLDVRNAGEYATTFRWVLWFDDVPNFLGNFIGGNVGSYLNQLNALCASSSLPTKSVEPMPIQVRGHRHFQPGRVVPNGEITLNFYETINNQVHRLFSSWQEAIWGHNIGRGVPYNDLVCETLCLTRLDNADRELCTYKLRWCFLQGYSNPQLAGATSGPFQTSITMSFNDFYIEPPAGTAFSGINQYTMDSYVSRAR